MRYLFASLALLTLAPIADAQVFVQAGRTTVAIGPSPTPVLDFLFPVRRGRTVVYNYTPPATVLLAPPPVLMFAPPPTYSVLPTYSVPAEVIINGRAYQQRPNGDLRLLR